MKTDHDTTASVARALVLHAQDNVATALGALAAGQAVQLQGPGPAQASAPLREPVALCHKFALRPIAAGETVIKYGESIGRASRAIAAGEHVHTHNLVSARAGRRAGD